MTSLKKIFGITMSLLAGVVCITPSTVCLESSHDTAKNTTALSQLERRLFFKTYAHNDLAARLERLERQVFGEPMTGSFEQRLAHLSAFRPTSSETVSDRQESCSVAYNQTLQAAATTTKTAETSTDNPEDKACLAERARIAVMAAKEEEVRTLLASGVELWRAGARREALEKFEQVIRLDPANAEAHYSMGIIKESQGNLVDAVTSYRLAVKAQPGNKEYLTAVTDSQRKLTAKQKVGTKQAELQHLAESALTAYKRGEYLSALDLYKTLDCKTRNQPLVKYNIGTIYLMLKVPEKALEYYKQAHKLNPSETKYIEGCKRLEQIITKDTT